MRTEIVDYLLGENLGSFTVSQELPWDDNGQGLYLKNVKRVYVDLEQITNESFIATLGSLNIQSEVTSVTIYFASDAKQLPSNYGDVVEILKAAKNLTTIDGVFRRDAQVQTTFENDLQVTQVEIRFTKLTT